MWFNKSTNLKQLIHLISLIASAIAIIGFQHNRYQKVSAKIANPDYKKQEIQLQNKLNLRKVIPSFGFDNLVADSLYLDFVQYFGDETARKATGYSLTPQYFKAIAQKDSQFINAHLTLATANSMYAGKADTTVSLVNQILQKTPADSENAHLLWSFKATDETIFLGDIDAARYSYSQAANLAQQQENKTSKAVVFYQQKIQFLATEPDTTEAQIIAWKSVLPHVVKEKEKKVIRDRIAALETKLGVNSGVTESESL